MLGDAVEMETVKVGGENIIVEIDETKLGKRKYNRRHRVEGVWVVAGVERTSAKKIFAREVENRNAETITKIIETYVLPGSIIFTDCWKAYIAACEKLNYQHFTVNHSENYKNPIDGTHTNTIEGNNNAIKINIKPQNRVRKNINEHLWFFIWKRQNKNNVWDGFLDALSKIFIFFKKKVR